MSAFTPGDLYVVRSPGILSTLICVIARGTRRPPRPLRERVSHAGIIAYEDGRVIEMRQKGWRWWRGACQSSHIPANAIVLTPPYRSNGQRRIAVTIAEAYKAAGTRYNWPGILAIALAQNGVHYLPGIRLVHTHPSLGGGKRALQVYNWLEEKLADSRDLFCSQMDDNCLTLVGVPTFDDGRPAGDVSPEDLYDLAESARWGIRKLGKALA